MNHLASSRLDGISRYGVGKVIHHIRKLARRNHDYRGGLLPSQGRRTGDLSQDTASMIYGESRDVGGSDVRHVRELAGAIDPNVVRARAAGEEGGTRDGRPKAGGRVD